MNSSTARVNTLSQFLTDEIIRTLGFSPDGWGSKVLGPLFASPTRRFTQIALEFDTRIECLSLQAAFQWMLSHFAKDFHVWGLENIPTEGPLLVVANHPGTIDTLLIGSLLPRADLKIIAGVSPFTQALPALCRYLIFSTVDTHARMKVVRAAIHHLEEGGAILLYPSGRLEPDPAILPGASESMTSWSRSTELFIRAVPDTQLVNVSVSHVLLPGFINHPFAQLRKQPKDKQRVAEFFQTVYQILFPKRFLLTPQLSFSRPILLPTEEPKTRENLTQVVISLAQNLLTEHLSRTQVSSAR